MIELSAEQGLALAFCGARVRALFSNLLQFDRNLARAVQQENAPIAGQIRLAWWRDQVAESPGRRTPSPMLDGLMQGTALARQLLTQIIDAWEILLAEGELSDETLLHYANGRGSGVFCMAATLSETDASEALEAAGTLWALVDFARHCADPAMSEHVLGLARAFCGSARRLPGSLRPFALLAYFAERDAIRGFDRLIPLGSPRRIAQAWKFSLGMG
ncbi:MAG: squalene/phytoene synthase family protein [Sphingomonadales bacterium]|nr:squalene/phytoene synthase family protein [Sphingomonadales bacterium]